MGGNSPECAPVGRYVAVVGPRTASGEQASVARAVGELLARAGCVVVTGGLGGVMAAAAAGAAAANGTAIGLLPGTDRAQGDPSHPILLPTGLGEGRNVLVVAAADGLIAVGGSWGTLSEVALARRTGKPVVCVGGWQVVPGTAPGPALESASSAADAVERLLVLLHQASDIGGPPDGLQEDVGQ